MSSWSDTRTAITALVRAGKSINEIIRDLCTSRSTVLRIKSQLAAGKDPQPSPQKRARPTLTPRVTAGLRRRIKVAPTKSLRRVPNEVSVPQELVRQVVQESGWKSLRKVKVPLVSKKGRQSRVECATGLLNSLKGVRGRSALQPSERLMDPIS